MKENQTLIFLNGDIPSIKVLKKLSKKSSFIVCADGGANKLINTNIKPDAIIGDLDSIKKKALKYFKKKRVEIIKITEQETTDFEKSLKFCTEKGLDNIIILGAISRRPDHTLNNLSVLKRYYNKLSLIIIEKRFEILFIRNKIEFDYKPDNIVSLMPLPTAKGITTAGLQFKLNDEDLEIGVREGTLNNAVSNKISISFKSGDLLLFKRHFL
jgi:thiamine pyrophosphokinase